jgi:hypothetical protein
MRGPTAAELIRKGRLKDLLQWRWPNLPGPLIAVVLAAAVVAIFGLTRYGIAVIGLVPTGLPTPAAPSWSDIPDLVLPAVGLITVSYADTILTARSLAARTESTVDANSEPSRSARSTSGPDCCAASRSRSASRTVLASAPAPAPGSRRW